MNDDSRKIHNLLKVCLWLTVPTIQYRVGRSDTSRIRGTVHSNVYKRAEGDISIRLGQFGQTGALLSGGNTITETIVEDGVEMLSTYSDQNGELVVKHYCALGTEPVFKVSEVSDASMSLTLDEETSGLHKAHHSFVTDMKWTMDDSDPNAMVFENSVLLDGEITVNRAELQRSM